MRRRNRSKIAVRFSSFGTTLLAPKQRQQRTAQNLSAARVFALVQEREQRVQDRRVRFEDFVEEDNFRIRKHAFGAAHVAAFAKCCDVDGAENFVRLRETRQQIFEVARLKELRESANQRRLRGARRTDEDRVLARDRRDEKKPNDFFLSEKARLELLRDEREPRVERDLLLLRRGRHANRQLTLSCEAEAIDRRGFARGGAFAGRELDDVRFE